MNSIIVGLTFISVVIAFFATIIAGLIKLIFFFKQKDSYRHILKYGLIGEAFGLLIIIGVCMLYRNGFNNHLEPDNIILIPFYLMLFGQTIGAIVIFIKKQRVRPNLK